MIKKDGSSIYQLSSKEITENQKTLLEKGGGFAIAPSRIPIEEYIVSTEMAGRNIHPGAAAALKAEVAEALKGVKKPQSNLSREEIHAIKEIKDDETIIVLPADKGKCIVVNGQKRIHTENGRET